MPLQPDHLAPQVRPLQGGSHARVSPSAGPRLSLPPPPSSKPAAPHRRGGFLSCTVSMALPAAAQTRSLLHPPPGPPRSRPADPPTLPLSAPTGSRVLRGSGAGPRGLAPGSRGADTSHVVRRGADRQPRNRGGSSREEISVRSRDLAFLSLCDTSPKTLGLRPKNSSLPRTLPPSFLRHRY